MERPPHTVCIVDDDPAVLRVIRQIVENGGYACRCFSSADEYLAGAQPTDACVITDLKMPATTGEALLKRIKETDPHLPVIVLTGHADVPTAVRLMELGAVTILEKPCGSIELMGGLARAIELGEKQRWRRDEAHLLRQRMAQLNDEELAVMRGIVRGAANKVLVSRLGMSARTLDRRRHAVFAKMGAQSAAELAALAERYNLFPNEPDR